MNATRNIIIVAGLLFAAFGILAGLVVQSAGSHRWEIVAENLGDEPCTILVTMGAEGEAIGVSLIDIDGERPFWRTTLPRTAARDMVRAGPAGPTFCVFQSRKSLYMLDPATGQLVWERSDLEPTSGLMSDPSTGLFGESECVVVFDGDAIDRGNYTVYRTSTG